MMQQYAAVYAASMGVMLVFKLIRGVVFVKVRTPGHRCPEPTGGSGVQCLLLAPRTKTSCVIADQSRDLIRCLS